MNRKNDGLEQHQEFSNSGRGSAPLETKFDDLIIHSKNGNFLTPILLKLLNLSDYISNSSLTYLESNLKKIFTPLIKNQPIQNQILVDALKQLSQKNMDPADISFRLKQEIQKYESGDMLFQKFKEFFHIINQTLKHEILNDLSVVVTNLSLFEKTGNKKFLNDIYLIIDKITNLIEKLEELEVFLIQKNSET